MDVMVETLLIMVYVGGGMLPAVDLGGSSSTSPHRRCKSTSAST